MKTIPYITFHYNDLGKGQLAIHDADGNVSEMRARSGSIDGMGKLQNVIDRGKWLIKTPHESTNEEGMVIGDSVDGWKTRLYTPKGEFTHFLIHPDGNKPGSLGCIVTPTMALDIRDKIDKLLDSCEEIPVFINVRAKC